MIEFFLVETFLDQEKIQGQLPSAITTEAPAPATNMTYTTPTIKPTATAAATATATNYCTLADRGAPRGGLY